MIKLLKKDDRWLVSKMYLVCSIEIKSVSSPISKLNVVFSFYHFIYKCVNDITFFHSCVTLIPAKALTFAY